MEDIEGLATPEKLRVAPSIAKALQSSWVGDATPPEPTHVALPWEKSYGKEKLAVIVPNVLSADECDAIIEYCEVQGFEQALLNVGGGRQILATDVRKSGRCIVDDVEAAGLIWDRLKHAIPETIEGYSGAWHCVGLNERFRVLKYTPGDYFSPHRDGSFERPRSAEPPAMGEPGDRSFFTLMLYLNTPAKGGGTNFISVDGRISPFNIGTGRALLFEHSIRHEGAKVEEGVKYAIRTDVMYRRVTNNSTGATGVEFINKALWCDEC